MAVVVVVLLGDVGADDSKVVSLMSLVPLKDETTDDDDDGCGSKTAASHFLMLLTLYCESSTSMQIICGIFVTTKVETKNVRIDGEII